jgi:hypothetical protein
LQFLGREGAMPITFFLPFFPFLKYNFFQSLGAAEKVEFIIKDRIQILNLKNQEKEAYMSSGHQDARGWDGNLNMAIG